MKKVLSIMLAACLLFALSATLVSCAHNCEFSTEWSKDDASHWHACTVKDCTETADKADHVWDEGQITTPATQEADGVKTFTCTVCSNTKTEPVAFTGMTEEEWDAAFQLSVFDNFAVVETANISGSGMSMETQSQYKFTSTRAWAKVTAVGQSEEQTLTNAAELKAFREEYVNSLKSLAPYENYRYDAETKTYKATTEIRIEALDSSTSDITLKFEDGKLVEIKYTVSFTQMDIDFNAESTVTLSDYGTVVLE